MSLTDSALATYQERGYLFLPGAFSLDEMTTLEREMPTLLAEDSPRRVLEKDGRTVRALHGVHTTNDVLHRLVRHPRLLGPAQEILGSDVYVHQFKINVKAAFDGDVWKWHQDFIFWLKQDGMQEPRAVNAFVFLDEVTEFNGALYLIPGSHRTGVIDVDAGTEGAGDWRASFSADLKYSLPRTLIADLVTENGLDSPKGPAGSVLFTHCNIVHGSPANMSPFDRTLVIITYNSVENPLLPVPDPRPEFLISRDFEALAAVGDDALRGREQGSDLRA